MACHISSLVVLLLVVPHCQSSQLPDSASSLSSGHKHRHQHQHRHHHQHHRHRQQPAVSGVTKTDDDGVQDVLKPEQGGNGEGVVSERRAEKLMSEAVFPKAHASSTAAVSSTTESAASVDGLSADPDPADEDNGQQSQRLSQHLDVQHQHSVHNNQEPGYPEKESARPEPSSVIPSSSKTSGEDRTLVHDADRKSIIDKQDGGRQSDLDDDEDSVTKTERNRTVPSAGAPKDNADRAHVKNVSKDRPNPGAIVNSSDEKLVNRPRWRYILRESEDDDGDDNDERQDKPHSERPQIVKNNIHNKTRRQNNEGNVSDPEREPEHGPDPKPDAHPPRRAWSHNRSRWNSSREKQESRKDSPSKSSTNQTEQANTDLPVNAGAKTDDAKKDKNASKKEKSAKRPAASKKVVKQKRKSKKPKRPLAKGCPGCSNTEVKITEARELHKQVLKAQLLDKLRLVPTFKKQPWPPKLPEQVFPDPAQRDHSGYDDQYYAKPTQLLVFGRDLGPRHRLKKPGTGSYQFNVTGKVKGAVTSARLWVYKMKDAHDVHEQTLVITELQFGKRRRLRERSLVARLDTRVEEGWVSFDVTRLVRRWMESKTPASLQMLAIRCKTCHRTNYRAIFGVKSNFRPVLVVRESRERARHKDKRSTCDPTNGCCKFDMVVSFEELGIHEIFRPRSIKADYCYGTCERPDAFHYNHTMIMQHMRFNSHVDNSTMRERLQPCCVPVVLREATIFHYLNSGLDTQVSLVPNLLVERCGCA